MQETIELESLATTLVKVGVKDEFAFPENVGAMVRLTKWTGRDSVPNIQIRPQIVTIDKDLCMEIEVRNPFKDKKLFLQKQDKIACLSVLSGPLNMSQFDREMSPQDFETDSKKWFRVAPMVLHRKGRESRPILMVCVIHTCLYLSSSYILLLLLVFAIIDSIQAKVSNFSLHLETLRRVHISEICEINSFFYR